MKIANSGAMHPANQVAEMNKNAALQNSRIAKLKASNEIGFSTDLASAGISIAEEVDTAYASEAAHRRRYENSIGRYQDDNGIVSGANSEGEGFIFTDAEMHNRFSRAFLTGDTSKLFSNSYTNPQLKS